MDRRWSGQSDSNGQTRNDPQIAGQRSPSSVDMTSNISYNNTTNGDLEGDLAMEDAADLDPYNKQKYEDVNRTVEYPVRQAHHSRPTSQYVPQEESSAARRYSPMKLSTTPGATSPAQYTSYTPSSHPASSRQSPSRPGLYSSQSYSSYYSSPRELLQRKTCRIVPPQMLNSSYYLYLRAVSGIVRN